MTIDAIDSAGALKKALLEGSPTSILSFSNPKSFAFAIIDKRRAPSPEDPEGELVGTVSFIRTSPVHLCTEIGFIVICRHENPPGAEKSVIPYIYLVCIFIPYIVKLSIQGLYNSRVPN